MRTTARVSSSAAVGGRLELRLGCKGAGKRSSGRGTTTWQGPCAHLAVGGVEADEADVHRLVGEAVAHLGARPPLVRHADAEVTPTKREATAPGKTAVDEGNNERTAKVAGLIPLVLLLFAFCLLNLASDLPISSSSDLPAPSPRPAHRAPDAGAA